MIEIAGWQSTSPHNARHTRRFLAGFDTRQIRQRLRFRKSDRSTGQWQVAQAVLWHPVFTGGAGDPGRQPRAQGSPVLSVCCPNVCYALMLLAGFDTCQIRQRLPALGQVLPNFQPLVSPQPPLPFACALGQSDRSTCHWQVAQPVLSHPVFMGSLNPIKDDWL